MTLRIYFELTVGQSSEKLNNLYTVLVQVCWVSLFIKTSWTRSRECKTQKSHYRHSLIHATVRACHTVLTQTAPIPSNAAYNMQLQKIYIAFHSQKAGWLQGLRIWLGSADQSRKGGPDGITGQSVTAHIGTVGLIDQNQSRWTWTIHKISHRRKFRPESKT